MNPGKFYPPTAQHAIRQAAVLANNIVAAMRGQVPQPFKFKIIGLLATIGRRHGVAEISATPWRRPMVASRPMILNLNG